MADGITVRVDTAEFDRWVGKFINDLRIDARLVVTDQFRMLIKQLIRFTAPNTYAEGRAAVVRDIRRAMTPIDPAEYTNDHVRAIMASGDVDAINAVLQQVPGWRGFKAMHFNRDLHAKVRDRRGRVTRSRKILVPEMKEHAAYVKEMQSHVGMAKGSWADSFAFAGGSGLPNYITRHAGRGFASVADFRADPSFPRLHVDNSARFFVSDNQFASSLTHALEYRVQAMKADFERRLELHAR